MQVTLARQFNSCCSANFYYTTEKAITIADFEKVFAIDQNLKKHGIVYYDCKDYILNGAINSTALKVTLKDKNGDINAVVSKLHQV